MSNHRAYRERQITEYRFSIRPRMICMTEIKEDSEWIRSERQLNNEKNLLEHKTKGVISEKSKKKLMTAIDWILYSAKKKSVFSMKTKSSFKFKVNFITLTIPPQQNGLVKEKKLKALINTWLTYHRKYSQLNNYVWKVEFHKDKRLHIHIAADTFIHYQSIRNSWNQILKRNGLLELHFAKFQTYDPNSTDVHSVKKVRKLGAYIAKYMSKQNEVDVNYSGRVWACCEKISKALKSQVLVTPDVIGRETRKLFNNRIEWKAIMSNPPEFGTPFCLADVFFLKAKDWILLQGTQIFNEFQEMIMYLRPNENQLKTQFVIN